MSSMVCAPARFYAELGKDDQCDYCGCTSFYESEGRPIGPRSKRYPELLVEWAREGQALWKDHPELFDGKSPIIEK